MKTCTKCLKSKPISEFHIHNGAKSSKSGIRSNCKACAKADRARWYAANKESEIAKTLAYQRANPAVTRKWARATYQRNLASRRARMKLAYERNPEKYLTACRKRYEEKKPSILLQVAKYRRTLDPLKLVESRRQYRKNNPERMSANANAARIRKQNAPGSHTLDEWKAVKDYFNHCCAYCLRGIDECGPLARDHVVPLTAGGSDDIDNIVPSCKPCNSSKNARKLIQFTLYRTLLAA